MPVDPAKPVERGSEASPGEHLEGAALAPGVDANPMATADSVPLAPGEQDLSLIESEMNVGATAPAAGASKPATGPGQGAAGRGIDAAAYEDVLRENIELRREVTDLQQGAEAGVAEKRNYDDQIRDLERQLKESVALLQKQPRDTGKGAAKEADKKNKAHLAELEAALQQAQTENTQLRARLSAVPAAGGPAPSADSDLFKSLQTENAELKRRVEEAANDRQAAAVATTASDAANARVAALKQALEMAQAEQARLQKTCDQLLVRVPGMGKELAQLRDAVGAKDRDLTTKSGEMGNLRLEMEKREQRLIKAERMTALMDKTREEVQAVSKKEQRDLHYNMATVYAKEGRSREAEQEYLHALRVDPTDAGSHYNLGLLYEDVFKDKRKAAMHYRAYLKLAPNADDQDEVKSWLVQLEMN